jgi:hypothetical protein
MPKSKKREGYFRVYKTSRVYFGAYLNNETPEW